MGYKEPPQFLAGGTFISDSFGYFYSEPPPIDLLKPEALLSENPWIRVASILEHAKIGNFEYVKKLERVMIGEDHPVLVGACFQLLGDIGTKEAVRILQSMLMQENSVFVVDACQAIRHLGLLWLVPKMLEARNHLDDVDDRDTITLIFSEMLEEKAGIIASLRHSDYTQEQHNEIVMRRFAELRQKFGSEKIPAWNGEKFSVFKLAQNMYDILLSNKKTGFSLYSMFLDLRQKFEASTGINCTKFFKNQEVQILAAAAILEQFLESPEADRYEEGVRYFWGHRIPD